MNVATSQEKMWSYSVHEAGHALVAYLSGFTITSIAINPTATAGACHVERGFDPETAGWFVRNHPLAPESDTLLSKLRRDIATWLAGIAAEDLLGAVAGDPAENERDRTCSRKLADHVAHAQWVRVDPRPKFEDRERPAVYLARMASCVAEIISRHETTLRALAAYIQESGSIHGGDAHAFLQKRGLDHGSLLDTEIP